MYQSTLIETGALAAEFGYAPSDIAAASETVQRSGMAPAQVRCVIEVLLRAARASDVKLNSRFSLTPLHNIM